MPRFGATLFLPGRAPSLEELALTRPRAIIRRNDVWAVADGMAVSIPWDTELLDVGGVWAPATPTDLVVPTNHAGLWTVTAFARFAANATGYRMIAITHTGSGLNPTVRQQAITTAGHASDLSVSGVFQAAVGDVFRCAVFQNSGAPLNLAAGVSYISAFRIG